MTRANAQNKVFAKLYGHPTSETTMNEQQLRFEKAQQNLFDNLFKDGNPTDVDYGKALREIRHIANDKTRDIREARDEAFERYSKLSQAFNMCWKEAWRTARDTMILEGNDERT